MKNPLYVVSKDGVDVEALDSIIDYWLKKLGLNKAMEMLNVVLETLLSEVKSYPVYLEIQKVIDRLFGQFIELLFQIQTQINKMTKK